MHYYIVDPQKIKQRAFERVQNELYSSLSEFRITGEVMRVTGLRTVNQLVENAFAHGAKTIVAVGSDDTLHDVINAIGGREMVAGFIPLLPSEIGAILGVNNISKAVKSIAMRRIEEVDLGVTSNPLNGINKAKNYFFTKVNLGANVQNSAWFALFGFIQKLFNLPEIEIKFSANSAFKGGAKLITGSIVNCQKRTKSGFGDPTDGILNLSFLPKLPRLKIFSYRKALAAGNFEKIPEASIIHVKKIEVQQPAGLPLRVGDRVIAKTPVIIEVLPKALKLIVGKERQF